MKKVVVTIAMFLLVSMNVHQSFAGGGEMVSDSMYSPYYNGGLTLEMMKDATRSSSIKKILDDNFEMISQNMIYEDYTFNATHYETKLMNYSIFIPEKLKSSVESISIEVQNSQMEYMILYEDTKIMNSQIPVEVNIDIQEFEGETLIGSIELSRDMFPVDQEYGASFTAQVYIVLKDRSMIPYSQFGYLYVNSDTIEGKKSDLINAYYNLGENIGYPDTARLLKNAFDKLEAKTTSLEEYLEILDKVSQRANLLVEKYTKIGDKIAEKVVDEMSFQENIEPYGNNMTKINLLSDAMWQISTEIETRKSAGIIEELFSDY